MRMGGKWKKGTVALREARQWSAQTGTALWTSLVFSQDDQALFMSPSVHTGNRWQNDHMRITHKSSVQIWDQLWLLKPSFMRSSIRPLHSCMGIRWGNTVPFLTFSNLLSGSSAIFSPSLQWMWKNGPSVCLSLSVLDTLKRLWKGILHRRRRRVRVENCSLSLSLCQFRLQSGARKDDVSSHRRRQNWSGESNRQKGTKSIRGIPVHTLLYCT